MYKTEFEHENNTNYMVIMPDTGAGQNDYQKKMIARNMISGLLPVSIRNINNKQTYYYDITSRQQLAKLYEYNKITLDVVRNICMGISDMIKSINDYMLDLDCVIVEPEYMYINIKNKKISFAYCPDIKHVFSEDLKLLFEYIIEHFDHNSDRNELMKVYEIYHKVVHDEYNPQELEELVSAHQPYDEFTADAAKEIGGDAVADTNDSNIRTGRKSEKENKRQNIKKVIPDESIQIDREEFDEKTFKYLKSARFVVVLLVFYMAASLFYPKISVIKMDIMLSIAVIAAGLVGNFIISSKIKNCGMNTNIATDSYSQPYSKTSNEDEDITYNWRSEDEYEKSEYESADIYGKEKENYQLYEGNTILLSEYIDDGKKKSELTLIPEDMDKNNRKSPDVNNSIIEISTFPCVIGSMKPYCDVIINNRVVSRMHVCIKKENENYYIEDMNSTNGTFVNDIRIKPGEKKKVEDADTIQIAALSYVVEIS